MPSFSPAGITPTRKPRRILATSTAAAFLTIGLTGPLPASAAPGDAECTAAQNTLAANFGPGVDASLLAELQVAVAAAVEAQAQIDGVVDLQLNAIAEIEANLAAALADVADIQAQLDAALDAALGLAAATDAAALEDDLVAAQADIDAANVAVADDNQTTAVAAVATTQVDLDAALAADADADASRVALDAAIDIAAATDADALQVDVDAALDVVAGLNADLNDTQASIDDALATANALLDASLADIADIEVALNPTVFRTRRPLVCRSRSRSSRRRRTGWRCSCPCVPTAGPRGFPPTRFP